LVNAVRAVREEVETLTGGNSEVENVAPGKRSINADGESVFSAVDISCCENIAANTSY
jgi:hypothetical protein